MLEIFTKTSKTCWDTLYIHLWGVIFVDFQCFYFFSRMKESLANVNGQLEKNEMTKEAMQKLCEALRTQVTLKDEENNLKLQEETQKRIDITKNFESTMSELTKLIEVHSKHNTSLREENKMMATKLEELLAEFESRENKIHTV